MITNADMTLYNKISGSDGPTYKRTHILSVNWQDAVKVNVGESGLISADVTTIFVPFSSNPGYLKPKEYARKPDRHFTLENGDIVVKGIIYFDLTTAKGQSEKDLRRIHDDVMTIVGVETNAFGSPHMHHWQVTAR